MKKQFSGNIRKLNDYAGELKKKLLGLKIQITPAETAAAKLSSVKLYHGKWAKVIDFGGSFKRLNVIARFLAIKSAIFHSYNAKVSSAPTIELKPENELETSAEVHIEAAPVADVKINHKETVTTSVKIEAHILALFRYIKAIILENSVKVISAIGAVFGYKEKLPLESTLSMNAADSVIIESRFNEIATEGSSAVNTAEAEEFSTDTTIIAEHSATMGTAETDSLKATTEESVESSCKIAIWVEPVLEDGVLTIVSVYGATQIDDVIEVI